MTESFGTFCDVIGAGTKTQYSHRHAYRYFVCNRNKEYNLGAILSSLRSTLAYCVFVADRRVSKQFHLDLIRSDHFPDSKSLADLRGQHEVGPTNFTDGERAKLAEGRRCNNFFYDFAVNYNHVWVPAAICGNDIDVDGMLKRTSAIS